MVIGGHVWRAVYRLRLPQPLVIDHLRRADGLKKGNVCVCVYILSRPHHSNAVTKLQWFTRSNKNGPGRAPGGHFAIQAHCVALTACWQARQPFAGQWRVLRPLE